MSINQRIAEIHYDADNLKFKDAAAEQEFYRALGYAVMWGSIGSGSNEATFEYASISVDKDAEIAVGHFPKQNPYRDGPHTGSAEQRVNGAMSEMRDTFSKGGTVRPFHMVGILREGCKYEFHS